jgi:hypothetical protein
VLEDKERMKGPLYGVGYLSATGDGCFHPSSTDLEIADRSPTALWIAEGLFRQSDSSGRRGRGVCNQLISVSHLQKMQKPSYAALNLKFRDAEPSGDFAIAQTLSC